MAIYMYTVIKYLLEKGKGTLAYSAVSLYVFFTETEFC